jgi:hypothetical protein
VLIVCLNYWGVFDMVRRCFSICGFLIGLLSLPNPLDAQPGASLEWRVKDRFRLFDRASPEARAAVANLFDEISRASPSSPFTLYYPALLRTLSGRREEATSASLRRSNYDPADERPNRASGRYRRDYLWPERYLIEIRDSRAASSELCTYSSEIDHADNRPCRQWTSLAVANGRDVSAADWHVETSVRVRRGTAESSIPIGFGDELVVALGDSYISGEGNPDVTSEITIHPDPVFRGYNWGGHITSAQVREAEWWDEPCHRSLLSWPVLASLVHAARDPHRAVTLVHLGCSGAVSGDLDLHGQRNLPGGGNEPRSQLRLLGELLRRPPEGWAERRVDTNGYTAGPLAPRLIGGAAGAVCAYEHSGLPLSRLCNLRRSSEARLAKLPGSLRRLAGALAAAGIPANRTFQPLYPNPLLNSEGQPCDTFPSNDASGFEALMGDIPPPFGGYRYNTWHFELQYLPEPGAPDSWRGKSGWLDPSGQARCDWAPEPGDSEICQALWVQASLDDAVARTVPWRRLSGHMAAMGRHGLCNRSDEHPRALPLVVNGVWRNAVTPRSADPRDPDSPRWFNLPNDSILSQYGFHGAKRHFRDGTVHPTFRGHVELADTAYRAAFGDR